MQTQIDTDFVLDFYYDTDTHTLLDYFPIDLSMSSSVPFSRAEYLFWGQDMDGFNIICWLRDLHNGNVLLSLSHHESLLIHHVMPESMARVYAEQCIMESIRHIPIDLPDSWCQRWKTP